MNRLSPAVMLLGFFGLLSCLAVAYGLKKSYEQKPKSIVTPKPQTVLLSANDLPQGRPLRNSDFYSLNMSPQAIAKKKWPALMMADGRQLVGRILKHQLPKDSPFSPELFYPEGTEPDITEKLRPGHRAMPVEVPIVGIPSTMTPGNWVEVLFRSKATKDDSMPEVTKTLVETAQVLAIGDNAAPGVIKPLNTKLDSLVVILAVSADQAKMLKVVEGHGAFSLVLCAAPVEPVPTLASKPELTRNLTLADVLDLPPIVEPPPPEKPPEPSKSEVFRRGQRQVLTFSPDGFRTTTGSQPPAPPKGNKADPKGPQTSPPQIPGINDRSNLPISTLPDQNSELDTFDPSLGRQLGDDDEEAYRGLNILPSDLDAKNRGSKKLKSARDVGKNVAVLRPTQGNLNTQTAFIANHAGGN